MPFYYLKEMLESYETPSERDELYVQVKYIVTTDCWCTLY